MFSRLSPAVRRGLWSAAICLGLLAIAMLPSRLASVMHGRGALIDKAIRIFSGATLDLSAIIAVAVPFIWLLGVVPVAVSRGRAFWQHLGPALMSLPLCFGLYILAITAQEVKSERGAYPTMFDLAEGGTNASFVGGALGFIFFDRIWVPLVVLLVLSTVVLMLGVRWSRRDRDVLPSGRWALGLGGGLLLGVLVVHLAANAQAAVANRASPAALGDPLTGIVESSFDMIRHQSAPTPRELIVQIELPADTEVLGASRMGWPPLGTMKAPAGVSCFHPHARPLGAGKNALLESFETLSKVLFTDLDGRVALFQLSLESFRADDIHALNREASPEIDPFTNHLYDLAAKGGGEGVLASSKMYQAGVRTAQGLGALTCGIGTLPYNLSIIRDLQPFAARCAGDVLRDAGFRGSFFYGSDATFDEMHHFLGGHGYSHIVSQVELPTTLPKGAWAGVTDFGVFDEATKYVAAELSASEAPVLSLVMSLSNHSPYTQPEDLPTTVIERVDRALKTADNRADGDDRRRLLTHSYTDAAVERFFASLESQAIDERSIVILSADHSTGESYVWGAYSEGDDAKARIPFAIVLPPKLMARVKDQAALTKALREAQKQLQDAAISQNDVPAITLALMSAHPGVKALPETARWHTLGGQVTSPWFKPGGEASTTILGINGVSEFFALDRAGARVGDYEDSVFLKTRADRYRVTPRLIPAAATLAQTMRNAKPCE